ncbi:unnamed protein product [Rotaria sp. Silwood2]|nr:unnamed protein product [Rotaria sp. Silwood2]CAF4197955.1 unnamed protein product [Rotaria sp. Silwood2]
MAAAANTTASSHTIQAPQRMAQNFVLIWLDSNNIPDDQICQNSLAQLRNVVNDVNIGTKPDECVDFLTEVDDMKAFLIITNSMDEHIVSLIHDIPHLDSIYIFSRNRGQHEVWVKKLTKIKSVFTAIKTHLRFIGNGPQAMQPR